MEQTVKGQPILICLKYFFSYIFFSFAFISLTFCINTVALRSNIRAHMWACVRTLFHIVSYSKQNYDFISCWLILLLLLLCTAKIFKRIVRVICAKCERNMKNDEIEVNHNTFHTNHFFDYFVFLLLFFYWEYDFSTVEFQEKL
jgi:hypothetical protein